MSTHGYEPHKRATWIIGAILVTAAVSGYFMGLQHTTSTLKMPEPVSLITPDSTQRAAMQTNPVPVAVPYWSQDWLREGPNADWEDTVIKLVQPQPDLAALTNVTLSDEDRFRAVEERQARRAFAGAPPVVPHPIVQDSSTACLACHRDGLVVKDRFAARISHDLFLSCTQCHVPDVGTQIPVRQVKLLDPLATNLFVGDVGAIKGSRAWPEAPPTIPHPIHMRDNCLSCHGPNGLFGLRTPHPTRQACTQCHAPDASLDQRDFLAAR